MKSNGIRKTERRHRKKYINKNLKKAVLSFFFPIHKAHSINKEDYF